MAGTQYQDVLWSHSIITAVLVEQVGNAMQCDLSFSAARDTLNNQHLVFGCTYQLVLRRLDRGDDVLQLTGATLLQERCKQGVSEAIDQWTEPILLAWIHELVMDLQESVALKLECSLKEELAILLLGLHAIEQRLRQLTPPRMNKDCTIRAVQLLGTDVADFVRLPIPTLPVDPSNVGLSFSLLILLQVCEPQ